MSRRIYDKVAADVGVSGDAKAEERWRPAGAPYPMPPMKTFPNGEVWIKGAEANGIHFVPAAVGMNSTEFKGRPACIYDGWCHVGCPIGALANPLVTYLGDARRPAPKCGALCDRHARSHQRGRHARHRRRILRRARKQKQVQEASVVMLAAWSAQNPRLLLNSATDKHPNGLANSRTSCVGKFMMTHHIAGTWALFDEDITPHMGTVGAQFMSYDRYAKTSYAEAPSASSSSSPAAGDEDDRLCASARRSVRRRAAGVHEARGARHHPHHGLRRGPAAARKPRRARERQGRIRHAARQADPQLRRRCGGAVERQFRPGHEDRQGHRRQGSVAGQGTRGADQPSAWRRHHGHGTRRTP